MIDVNVITLEDNLEYMIINTIVKNNNKYVFLANVDDEKKICIRKVISEDGKDYLEKLDSDEEFAEVLTEFNDKYNKEREN